MWKTALLLLSCVFGAGSAFGQGVIRQNGPVTAGHLPMFIGNGLVMDAGGSAGAGLQPANKQNAGSLPTGLGVVNSGLGFCDYSGYSSAPYSQGCWGFDASGNFQIKIDRIGGGTVPGFNVVFNGASYGFPGTGNGNIVGPISTTINDFMVWANTGGTLAKDGAGAAIVHTGSLALPTIAGTTVAARKNAVCIDVSTGAVLQSNSPYCGDLTATNNAALVALPAATNPFISRQGFYTAGDGGAAIYRGTNAACTTADNGAQVTGSDGKCFIVDLSNQVPTPKLWGAKGDGATDDTTAVQAAMNYGGTINLGPNIYAVSGLVCNSPIKIVGDEGNESGVTTYTGFSGFRPTSVNQVTLTLNVGCTGSIFKDVFIDSGASGTNTSGGAIRMVPQAITYKISNITLSGISINAPCIGMDINGNSINVERTFITQVQGAGCGAMRIGHNTINSLTTDVRIHNATLQANQSAPSDFGLKVEDSGGLDLDNVLALYSKIGTYIFPGASQAVIWTFASSSVFGDTTLNEPLKIDTGDATAQVNGFFVTNSWASGFGATAGSAGILIANSGGVTPINQKFNGFQFNAMHVLSTSGNSVTVNDGYNVQFNGSQLCGAGDDGAHPNAVGIELGVNVGNFMFNGSIIGNNCNGAVLGANKYQIKLDGGNSGLMITGNKLYGWATAAISGSPVQTSTVNASVIRDNLGVDDQNPVITAAGTIDPTTFTNVVVSGVTPITIINGCIEGRRIIIRPTAGPVQFNTGGNIAASFTAPDNIPVTATCYGSPGGSWYIGG